MNSTTGMLAVGFVLGVTVSLAAPAPIVMGSSSKWKDRAPISFQLAQFPGESFLLMFPENITAREMSWRAKPVWKTGTARADATWTKGPYSYTLQITWRETKQGPVLDWEYRFENKSSAALTDVSAFNCFLLAGAPTFFNRALDRTWVSQGEGEKIWLSRVKKTNGPRPMQFYPAKSGIRLDSPEHFAHHGVTSPAELTGDRIGVVSTDGRWKVESVVDGPVAYFFNNSEPDHGCIHAAPLLGSIAPGQAATAKGRIVFTRP